MSSSDINFYGLTDAEFGKIKQLGVKAAYKKGDLVFSDGENADHMYFIESGRVSIFIQKFTRKEEVCTMGEGEYFGEMAFFNGDKRSASVEALLDSTLLSINKKAFLELFDKDQVIADKINQIFAKRNEELTVKEQLTSAKVGSGEDFQLGIKGDPSIRESAFSRERHENVVDKIIIELQPRLYDLLVNRSAYELFIHCNSGEVHVRNVFDPFHDDIHPADKLLNVAYVERHFPLVDYEEKTKMVKRLYRFIHNDVGFIGLPDRHREALAANFMDWEPVGQREMASTISKLSSLRRIPDFYLRNFTISFIRDAIRIQFNCDGTHILNANGFQTLLEQNMMEEDEVQVQEKRQEQRRDSLQGAPVQQQGERRSPAGRRQADWESIIDSKP